MPRSVEQKASRSKKEKAMRARKRKCVRCKLAFKSEDGKRVCAECLSKCSRCNIILTKENTYESAKKNYQYRCVSCTKELSALSVGSGIHSRSKDYRLIKEYGITVLEYNKLLEAQNGSCWICLKQPTGNSLHVDHEHVPGERRRDKRERRSKIRGLLCWHCNSSIAKFKDNIDSLKRAARYLEEIPAQKILKENIYDN